MNKRVGFQQGDVLIEAVASIPDGAAPVAAVNGRIILAEGEHTGHAHAIADAPGITLVEKDGTLYLRVDGVTATVVHEEHNAQTIPPGSYKIGRVREVDPFENAIRYVAD
jgi:hypothetical protein